MAARPVPPSVPAAVREPDRRSHLVEAQAMPAGDPRRVVASIAMFDRLCEHWSLRGDERETLLGGVAKSTWSEWRHRPALARIKSDTRERIANLSAIDLNAHSLFAPEFADRWVREPNAAFQGESPLQAMMRGKVEDVIAVRRYLERIRTSAPPESSRSRYAGRWAEPGVSFLPGRAEGPADEDDALPALRQAVEVYEALVRERPNRYRTALAAALNALATCLEERDDPEALPVLRREITILRETASQAPGHELELARSLSQLAQRLAESGDATAARSASAEVEKLLERRRLPVARKRPKRT